MYIEVSFNTIFNMGLWEGVQRPTPCLMGKRECMREIERKRDREKERDRETICSAYRGQTYRIQC